MRLALAEELVVYPVLRREIPGGNVLLEASMTDHFEVEEALVRLEKLQGEPVALRACLLQLRRDLSVHIQHKELGVLASLEAHLRARDLQDLATRYAKALNTVPRHPHPHVPDALPSTSVVAPVAVLVDQMREAMTKTA